MLLQPKLNMKVSQRQVLAQLRGDGPYASAALADDMARALGAA